MKFTIVVENSCGTEGCIAEHGLGVYIETEKHRILFDTGASGESLIVNSAILDVDLTEVDTLVLSHGHYDHSGGIMEFAKVNDRAEIYVKDKADGDYVHADGSYIGIDPQIMQLRNLRVVDTDFLRIDDELSVFSKITGRKLFPFGNRALLKKVGGETVPDDFVHEQILVIEANDKKILLSGCAHNGIINILERYREIYGGEPDVVIGGLHLMNKNGYSEEETEFIRNVGEELTRYNTVFYSGHCTGEAITMLKEIMGSQLIEMHTGLQFEI